MSLGLAGSALLIVGVFLPVASVPTQGAFDYFLGGEGDGVLILLLGVASLILAGSGRCRWLWLTGAASLAVMVCSVVSFHVAVTNEQARLAREHAGDPFRFLGEALLRDVQLEWGLGVLLVGALLVIAASIGPITFRPAAGVADAEGAEGPLDLWALLVALVLFAIGAGALAWLFWPRIENLIEHW